MQCVCMLYAHYLDPPGLSGLGKPMETNEHPDAYQAESIRAT